MIMLTPGSVTLTELRAIWDGAPVTLDAAAYAAIDASAEAVARIVVSGETVYGVNTGFGLLAQTRIPDDQLAALMKNLAHALRIILRAIQRLDASPLGNL